MMYLSDIGGIIALLTGVVLVVRAILKLVTATRDNTIAIASMNQILVNMKTMVEDHTVEMARLGERMNGYALRNSQKRQ
jgi:hypothetical protein